MASIFKKSIFFYFFTYKKIGQDHETDEAYGNYQEGYYNYQKAYKKKGLSVNNFFNILFQ
jgi:hypothetical protein